MTSERTKNYWDLFKDMDKWIRESENLSKANIRSIKRYLLEQSHYRELFPEGDCSDMIIRVELTEEVDPAFNSGSSKTVTATVDRIRSTIRMKTTENGTVMNDVKVRVGEEAIEYFFRRYFGNSLSRGDLEQVNAAPPDDTADASTESGTVSFAGNGSVSFRIKGRHPLVDVPETIAEVKEIVVNTINRTIN